MKIKGILLFLAIVILLPSNVLSQENQTEGGIEKVIKIDIDLDSNGFVKVYQELSLSETTGKISIPKTIENLLIYDDTGNDLGYEFSPSAGDQLLKFYLKSPENRNVKVSYTTQALTVKNVSVWTLNFRSMTTSRATIVKISFPQSVNITSFRTNQTVYLYPPDLKSPVFLYPQEDYISFDFDYSINNEPITDNMFLYLGIFVILAVFVSIFTIYTKTKSKSIEKKSVKHPKDEQVEAEIKVEQVLESKKTDKKPAEKPDKEKHVKSSVLNMLDENEKKIVLMLEESDMEITQAYIYKTLGIPKASLSNIINRLEQRNLIEKKKEGRINWIKLKEWVFS